MVGRVEEQSFYFEPILSEAWENESGPTREGPIIAEADATVEPEASSSSEEALVELARQGNTEAFGELIQRHYKTCLKRAASMMRKQSDAEEEVQTTWWEAVHRLD